MNANFHVKSSVQKYTYFSTKTIFERKKKVKKKLTRLLVDVQNAFDILLVVLYQNRLTYNAHDFLIIAEKLTMQPTQNCKWVFSRKNVILFVSSTIMNDDKVRGVFQYSKTVV